MRSGSASQRNAAAPGTDRAVHSISSSARPEQRQRDRCRVALPSSDSGRTRPWSAAAREDRRASRPLEFVQRRVRPAGRVEQARTVARQPACIDEFAPLINCGPTVLCHQRHEPFALGGEKSHQRQPARRQSECCAKVPNASSFSFRECDGTNTSSRPTARAAALIDSICCWLSGRVGLNRMPVDPWLAQTRSATPVFSGSSSTVNAAIPVTLPPGRLRLATRPPTGSATG